MSHPVSDPRLRSLSSKHRPWLQMGDICRLSMLAKWTRELNNTIYLAFLQSVQFLTPCHVGTFVYQQCRCYRRSHFAPTSTSESNFPIELRDSGLHRKSRPNPFAITRNTAPLSGTGILSAGSDGNALLSTLVARLVREASAP